MTGFIALAVALTALAGVAILWPLLRNPADRAAIAAAVAVLALPGFVLFAYLAASNHDWAKPPGPAAPAAAGPLEVAVAQLEARLKADPSDQAGWVLLGSSYTALGRPEDAIGAYTQADQLARGANVDARLGIAEARLLMDRSTLTGEVGDTIEAVLAAAPDNPKALWYGGLVALGRGDAQAAERRWTALLALSPPERIRQVVEAELASLRGEAAGSATVLPATGSVPAKPPRLTVRVQVAEALRGAIKPGAPVFVFVRDAAGGPPLAVVRRTAAELPLAVEISDADVMVPGRSLAGVARANVVARIANGGDPVARPGDAYGESQWAAGEAGDVGVLIDRMVAGP